MRIITLDVNGLRCTRSRFSGPAPLTIDPGIEVRGQECEARSAAN